ncbi:MAG: CalY family protein [Oscillospiraceae bacterium]|nr:CalY family protein [Oscillospiraceae bacterium]
MKKNNKKLTTILLVFALVLVVGGVYAAATGVLSFEGVANLNESPVDNDLLLELYENDITVNSNDGSTGTMEISADRQTAHFTVDLLAPGSEVFFSFDVRNTGTLDAFLYDFNYNSETHSQILGSILEFNGSYQTLENSIIYKGDEVTNLTFGVKWKDDAEDFYGEQVAFKISISYVDNQFYLSRMQ